MAGSLSRRELIAMCAAVGLLAPTTAWTSSMIEPFRIAIPDTALNDLKRRLAATRWPEREPVAGWEQGAPLASVQALCRYWADGYDWRRCERTLNSWPQFRTPVDGLRIHFFHIRSPERGALPLLLPHGWPGSIIEFHRVIGPLTDPVRHGGRAADAFDVIVPSLPGYGFSDKPAETGWGVERIGRAFATLMDRLGYERWVISGGDWGANIAAQFGAAKPKGLAALHFSTLFFKPDKELRGEPKPDELPAVRKFRHFEDQESGYFKQQATRPQTLGYALADSPTGQAAWIYEKLRAWSDHRGDVEALLGRDAILDNIMLYWLTNTAASSARLYLESEDNTAIPTDLPVAVSIFPNGSETAPRRWAERYWSNIVHWGELDRGGHFAPWEQPALFVDELRRGFGSVR